MIFSGVKNIAYPGLGSILYIIGFGGSQTKGIFSPLIRSVYPPRSLVEIFSPSDSCPSKGGRGVTPRYGV